MIDKQYIISDISERSDLKACAAILGGYTVWCPAHSRKPSQGITQRTTAIIDDDEEEVFRDNISVHRLG